MSLYSVQLQLRIARDPRAPEPPGYEERVRGKVIAMQVEAKDADAAAARLAEVLQELMNKRGPVL